MNQWPIQVAIFDILSNDADITARVEGVFDHVPQGTAYPYIVIGDDTGLQWDTDDSLGTEATLTLHVWSEGAGRKETKEIMQLIYDALHRVDIQVDGLHTVLCQWEFSETLLDADGVRRHGVMRFRLIGEE